MSLSMLALVSLLVAVAAQHEAPPKNAFRHGLQLEARFAEVDAAHSTVAGGIVAVNHAAQCEYTKIVQAFGDSNPGWMTCGDVKTGKPALNDERTDSGFYGPPFGMKGKHAGDPATYFRGYEKGVLTIPERDFSRYGAAVKLTPVHEYSYKNCEGLKSVFIPKTVKRIGKGAFQGSGLIHLTFDPEFAGEIGEDAFKDTKNLKSVHIPKGVTVIGTGAFDGSSLTDARAEKAKLTFAKGFEGTICNLTYKNKPICADKELRVETDKEGNEPRAHCTDLKKDVDKADCPYHYVSSTGTSVKALADNKGKDHHVQCKARGFFSTAFMNSNCVKGTPCTAVSTLTHTIACTEALQYDGRTCDDGKSECNQVCRCDPVNTCKIGETCCGKSCENAKGKCTKATTSLATELAAILGDEGDADVDDDDREEFGDTDSDATRGRYGDSEASELSRDSTMGRSNSESSNSFYKRTYKDSVRRQRTNSVKQAGSGEQPEIVGQPRRQGTITPRQQKLSMK